MVAARAAEYRKVTAKATTAASRDENARLSLARRLRAELRRIHRRDYFPPTERDQANAAVDTLAQPITEPKEQPS